MPNYSSGKVYKIVNSMNDIIYIGSTCQQLCSRMTGHRAGARTGKPQALYCSMRDIGVEKFRIILIEDFPCSNKSQLEAREFKHMADAQFAHTQLYNHMIGGHHSKASREKIGKASTGRTHSLQSREKMSQVRKGKRGEQTNRFKRGCVSRTNENQGRVARWAFNWNDDGPGGRKRLSFSVKKYGESAAHAFALIAQDEVYPKVDDDKEFIEEIRARVQSIKS